MTDLFNNETIRTLGLYQPFATLMIHGKIETRWVMDGKRPGYPLGKYLIYSTKKFYNIVEFQNIAGRAYNYGLDLAISRERLCGHALCVGYLVEKRKYIPGDDVLKTFVDHPTGKCSVIGDDGLTRNYTLWCLVFHDMRRIKPIRFKGKQGIGFLPEEKKHLIEIV